MADQQLISIPFHLPRCQSLALAQFCKRVRFDVVTDLAAVSVVHNGQSEADLIWLALTALRSALAEAGFAPR